MTDALEVRLRVSCEHFPEPDAVGSAEHRGGPEKSRLWVGVQRDEEIEQFVDVAAGKAQFEVRFTVKRAPNGAPNFLGPYAKGTPTERFFYLVWIKRDAHGGHERCGRTKVPLGALAWKSVEAAANSGKAIGVTLTMSDAKGRARMGSLKPQEIRWEV